MSDAAPAVASKTDTKLEGADKAKVDADEAAKQAKERRKQRKKLRAKLKKASAAAAAAEEQDGEGESEDDAPSEQKQSAASAVKAAAAAAVAKARGVPLRAKFIAAPVLPPSEIYQKTEFIHVKAIPGKGKGCVAAQPIALGTCILSEDGLSADFHSARG
jgi:hypothetical protein